MSKITPLANLANLQNEVSAVVDINANSAAITTAFNNTLSLDGSASNQMQADFDMNNNHILNITAPNALTDLVRLTDLTTLSGGGSVVINNAPNVLLNNVQNQHLTGGWTTETQNPNPGTVSHFVVDFGVSPLQTNVNTAFADYSTSYIINAPTSDGECTYLFVNGVGAGTYSFVGFTVAVGGTGDPTTTTVGHMFAVTFKRISGISFYHVQALQ